MVAAVDEYQRSVKHPLGMYPVDGAPHLSQQTHKQDPLGGSGHNIRNTGESKDPNEDLRRNLRLCGASKEVLDSAQER